MAQILGAKLQHRKYLFSCLPIKLLGHTLQDNQIPQNLIDTIDQYRVSLENRLKYISPNLIQSRESQGQDEGQLSTRLSHKRVSQSTMKN
jgi:hypothetical protein